jgi:hypothetical protein
MLGTHPPPKSEVVLLVDVIIATAFNLDLQSGETIVAGDMLNEASEGFGHDTTLSIYRRPVIQIALTTTAGPDPTTVAQQSKGRSHAP